MSKTINILRNLLFKKAKYFGDATENFSIGLCTLTPSSDHSLLILNLPLTLSRPLSHLCDGRSHSFRDHGRIFATKTKALLRLP